MSARAHIRRAIAVIGAAALLTAAGVVSIPTVATADTKPATGVPATVSSDALPTAQLSGGVGWTQAVIGNTVYVGGDFTGARAAGASSTSTVFPRANMLAYSLSTGALNTTFAPSFNAQIRALAASPDGKTLYVGGSFTTVNGTTATRLAAVDPSTGALKTGWSVTVNGTVTTIAATASTVYFGGGFSSVNGTRRILAAAVSASTGALTAWNPVLDANYVRALVLSPDGKKVALGGGFSTLNGVKGPGFGIVDATTGTTTYSTPIRSLVTNGSASSAIFGMSSDGTNVYASGYYSQGDPDKTGNLEGTFAVSWSSGATVWIEDCHGDEYANAAIDGVVYVVGHPHYCADVPGGFPQSPAPTLYQRGVAFTAAATGTLTTNTLLQPRYYDYAGNPAPSLLSWFPDLNAGSYTGSTQAAWTVLASGNYVLMAGEFPKVNGGTQYGLVRFAKTAVAPNTDGPVLSGAASPVNTRAVGSGSVRVSWLADYDRDNENLTYSVYRDSTLISTQTAASRGWSNRPTLSFTDTGQTVGSSHTYKVVASDPFGNSATSGSSTITVTSTALSAYAKQVLADGASSYWRLDEKGGTAVTDLAGGYPATTHGAVTFGAGGAVSGDSDTAATFDGASTTGIASNAFLGAGNTLSVGAWFKTTSAAGGEIVGMGDAQQQTTTTRTNPMTGQTQTFTFDSGNHDRELSTTSTGAVTFTVVPGSKKTITSASGYNDGKWHQAVGTIGANGTVLYVDGVQVAKDSSVTRALGAGQYWRIGGDSGYATASTPGQMGPPPSSSNYFAGQIDEPAAYVGTVLTAAKVANQYALATGGSAPTQNSAPTASFSATPSGLSAAFDGSASSDSDGTVASYAWTFGDGSTGTGRTTTHTYASAGTEHVTLTVTDDKGATGTTSKDVSVTSPTTPPTATVTAADAFSRTVTSGLGTADTGGAWTASGGATNFSVASGAARFSTAKSATLTGSLAAVSTSSADITASITPSAVPAGGSLFTSVIGRSVSGASTYSAKLTLKTTGDAALGLYTGSTALKAVTVSGLTYTAGTKLSVRVQVFGSSPTTIRAKVWVAGTTEPADWTASVTNSAAGLQTAGSVGLQSYAGSGVTNGPIVVAFDDLRVVPVAG